MEKAPYPVMSDREMFLLDTQGYLRIRHILTAQELEDLNAAFDANEDMDSICDRSQENAYGGGMSGHSRGSINHMLDSYPEESVAPFLRLIADGRLEPYL